MSLNFARRRTCGVRTRAPVNGRTLLSILLLATGFAAVTVPPRAVDAAPPTSPPPLVIPKQLSLDQAVQIFHERGLDLLIAEANVSSAEADVTIAGALPNPAVNAGIGKVFGYKPDEVCTNNSQPPGCGTSSIPWTVGVADNGALADILSGKRGLRTDVAKKALQAAKLARVDAQRVLEFQVKQAYVQVAQARAALDFSKETAEAAAKSLELNKLRYPKVIDEGTLARVETAKLESDQAVDMALQNLRSAQIALGFLLGARSVVPDFAVDESLMKGGTVPPALANASEDGLVRMALEHRADLLLQQALKERGEAEITLGKRLKFPDFILSLQYSQTGTGNNAIQPPTLMFGITIPLPLFYTYSGEVKKGEADVAIADITHTKVEAQIVNDVSTAFAQFVAARKLVDRMETTLLASAKKARDITEFQFNAGAAPLMDFLDAQRTFIATRVEYLQDLTNLWTAVFQIEQAVGLELRK